MKPIIALVGRPNVGKSTLFNRLTRSRQALVADQPGLTRDRIYGTGSLYDHAYIVIDTAGLGDDEDSMQDLMAGQSYQAVTEADIVFFLVDGRSGLSASDETIARRLRQSGKKIYLLVNKAEGLDPDMVGADFQSLGLGEPHAVSAAHGDGVKALLEAALEALPPAVEEEEASKGIKIAVAGRPNVGKSTLVNRMLGEERVVVYDRPGTTRDSVFIPFERDGEPYTLIDTAGVRRRGKVSDMVEKFSVVKTLQAIEAANVVILVLDARSGVTDQDATLAGFILEAGRALVIAVNKWDGLSQDERQQAKTDLQRKLHFLDFADVHFISALHGSGVGNLFPSVGKAYQSAMADLSTSYLNKLLLDIVTQHPPPLVRGRRIKLRYAHQGGQNPPRIIIHGNQTDALPGSYQRYLENTFRKVLKLHGTPIRFEFRTGDNPYEGRKNKLTRRQVVRKKRLKKFVKRKS
jgi:GTP-binding protein